MFLIRRFQVCCPGFDDALSSAVRNALTQGADTGLLDYLVLETSGAADPRRIVGALEEPSSAKWMCPMLGIATDNHG